MSTINTNLLGRSSRVSTISIDSARTKSNTSWYKFETEERAKRRSLPDSKCTQFMKRNKKCVIVSSVIIVLLLIALITFVVLYCLLVLSRAQYGESCESKTCNPDKQLTCGSSNICTCKTGYYYDGITCSTAISYGSNCYGGTFQCSTSLSCINNICQCSSTTYYNGSYCVSKLAYGSACSSCTTCSNCNSCVQCDDSKGLSCDATTSTCLCSSDYYLSSGSCRAKLTYNRGCTSNTQCLSSLNLICATGSASRCPTTLLTNRCNCPTNYYWNGSICKTLESYYGSCSTGTCSCGSNLICSSSDNVCVCADNYYWNGLTCVTQLSIGDSCTASSECATNLGLSCLNGKCSCTGVYPGNYYWSTLILQCVECPSGWSLIAYNSGYYQCVAQFYNKLSAADAIVSCATMSARLLEIVDSTQLTNLKSTFSTTGAYYHLGGQDSKNDGTFLWNYDGSTVDMNDFCNNEPNGNTNENCLSAKSWCYNDISCTSPLGYFCQKYF